MSDTATFEAKITELGDKLAGLTLKEAVDLTDYMKDTPFLSGEGSIPN